MEKQTKNIITREWVEKELRFYNTADIRYTLIVCAALSLLCLPITAICIYGVLSEFQNAFFKIVLCIVVVGVLTAPVWLGLLSLWGSIVERKLLKNGDFDIVTRELLYKEERTNRRHIDEFFGFDDFDEIKVGHTAFQMASQGDEFYIVHYLTKKQIKLLYAAKMYEYR